MADAKQRFLDLLAESVGRHTFVRLSLGDPHGPDRTLRKVLVRPVTVRGGEKLAFVYQHATRDVTKNLSAEEGLALLERWLGADFHAAHLSTTETDAELAFQGGRARLRLGEPSRPERPDTRHDRTKRRVLGGTAQEYLVRLGVTTEEGRVRKGMERKHAQLHRFIEIVADLLRSSELRDRRALSVVDMGSGKGYLTFALYDYLTRVLGVDAAVTGVEAREELVALCNEVAAEVGFEKLRFRAGRVLDYDVGSPDVLIALHACDTATDEAIFRGIRAGASLVICAPCCHQELRPQLRCRVEGLDAVLENGILLERQAELVTDGVRALLLEASGYRTRVFEFIAAEHTTKNVMIAAVKAGRPPDRAEALARVAALKRQFGFGHQRLEGLLAGRR